MNHPEAVLIEKSLIGDTEAFGGLVSQYQSLICAVTYSRCGDVERSQELAQETFITAWRNLRSLQDRGKFKSWLCGIARNVAHSAYRKDQREPVSGASALDELGEPACREREPDEEAMEADDGVVVWSALERLPESYREPMVLYYREEKSVERVAEALGLSRDAVKQRLARGRAMLKDRVHALVEGALEGTRPGPAFTIAVVTALPMLVPSTASAALIATTAKGSAAAKSAMGLAWLGPIAGGAVGLLGAWFGVKSSLDNCQSSEEREAVKRMAWWALGLMGVFGAIFVIMVWGWRDSIPMWPLLGAILGYVLALLLFIAYWVPKVNRIRRRHAPVPERDAVPVRLPGGREFISKASLWGLPLVHLAEGRMEGGQYRRGKAKAHWR